MKPEEDEAGAVSEPEGDTVAPAEEALPGPKRVKRPRPKPRARVEVPRGGMTRPAPIFDVIGRWLDEPHPILRVELVRVLAPLATLGFMSGRLRHADEWLSDAGFQVPNLGVADYRQPFYLAPLPSWGAWLLAAVMVLSGLAVSLGLRTRRAALVFAATLAYVALADRLAAFTVSKLSPAVMLALALSPAGSRLGVDAWLARKNRPDVPRPTRVAGGTVRFYQGLLCAIYFGSGIAKVRGDWLSNSYVLWSHLHDSYQTTFSFWVANALPGFAWPIFQAITLLFEVGAPLWFSLARTRTAALVWGLGMHAMIGLMFGPVRWFALLMIAILLGAFLPEGVLERAETRLRRA